MTGLSTVDLLVAFATGAATAGVVGLVVRPTPRLGPRLRPYTVGARTALGTSADVAAVPDGAVLSGDALRRVLAPALLRLGRALGSLTDRGDEALAQRLRQAGMLADVPEPARVQTYRLRQLSATAGAAAGALALGLVLSRGAGLALGLALLGGVVGATRWPARLDRAIEARRARMAIELYTVNQLLALQIRAGSGATQALQRVVQRGDGVVVDELHEVLAVHRGGRPLAEALEQAARVTPEANAARTYRLLASGVAYGADLAEGLRALSDDIRQHRTETLKRTATKRRAAMLVPIIAILAPVMLLFVAAPLPSLVLGSP